MKTKVIALLLVMATSSFASDVPSAMNPTTFNGSSRSTLDVKDINEVFLRNDISDIERLKSLENFDGILEYMEIAVEVNGLDEGLLLNPDYLMTLSKDEAIKLIMKSLGDIEQEIILKAPKDDEGLKTPDHDENLKRPADDENL